MLFGLLSGGVSRADEEVFVNDFLIGLAVLLPIGLVWLSICLHPVKREKMYYLCPMDHDTRLRWMWQAYLCAGLIHLIGISMILLLFPYQAYAHDRSFYPSLICMYALYNWGIQIYAGKYSLVRQNGKTHPIEELLCYVPVSKRQIILYRIKKVQKPVIRLALFNLLVKCFLSCVIYHSISVFDIILPVLFLLFVPFLLLMLPFLRDILFRY